MKCPSCTADVLPGNGFCTQCGAPAAQPKPAVEGASLCPACHERLQPGAKFCRNCGRALILGRGGDCADSTEGPRCERCGGKLKPGAIFCKNCGARAELPTPAAENLGRGPVDTPHSSASTAPAFWPSNAAEVAQSPAEYVPRSVASSPSRRTAPMPVSFSVPQPKVLGTAPTSASKKNVFSRINSFAVSAVALMTMCAGFGYWYLHRGTATNRTAGNTSPQAIPTASSVMKELPGAAPPTSLIPSHLEAPSSAEPQEAAGEMGPGPAPASTPVKAGRPTPRVAAAPAPTPPPPYQEAHLNATTALSASRFLDPPEDNALFWARKAKSLGDPEALQIEQRVFEIQMSSLNEARSVHDYPRAQSQALLLARNFPEHTELQQMQSAIQQEQQQYAQQLEQQRHQAELEARTKRIQVRHRHFNAFVLGGASSGNNNVTFCSGTLTITPDGAVQYDCVSADNLGHCEHVSFPAGSLKEVKIRSDGSLHLSSRQSGNFDFYGPASDLQGALGQITQANH